MKQIKLFFPNLLTIANLLAGSISIVLLFTGDHDEPKLWPVYLILIAAVFDLLDGMVARLLNAQSEFGKQLDSLADIVSFGLAPSMVLYSFLIAVLTENSANSTFFVETSTLGQKLLLYSAFTIVIFAALRLARFNIQDNQSDDFVGLPVPASALVVCALWIVFQQTESNAVLEIILNLYFTIGLIFLLSILMVSKLPMISLKLGKGGFGENVWKLLVVVVGGLLLIIFGIEGLLPAMGAYILLSLVKWIVVK